VKRLAISLVIVASLAAAPVALAKPSWSNTRMAGLWITTDCVTAGVPPAPSDHYFDCGMPGPVSGIPGDASAMSLDIASGAVPAVRLVDTYATYCVTNGLPARFVATGYGRFTVPPETEARTMVVTLTDSRCGDESSGLAPIEMGLYLGQAEHPTGDSLWDDDPGNTDWGHLWERGD